jgi:APA family basic amino acid/polyamine antiporter
VLFTTVCLAGVRASRVATNALAVLIVVGIAALAIASVGSDAVSVAPNAASGFGTAALSALVPIFFTYSGWNAAAYVAGEFRDPGRSIPRALVGGTLAVTMLYVAINAAMLRALSTGGLATAEAPVASTAALTMGTTGQWAVTLLVLGALASSVCAMVITGPRIYSEMARDGVLPRLFATSERRTVPVASAIAQSLWSAVLVLTGTFGQIVTYTGFSIVVFSGAAVCALFMLRRRGGAPVGYKVPGYPWVPALFVASCVAITIASVRYAPGPSLVGLALILLGLPLRLVLRQRAAIPPTRNESCKRTGGTSFILSRDS